MSKTFCRRPHTANFIKNTAQAFRFFVSEVTAAKHVANPQKISIIKPNTVTVSSSPSRRTFSLKNISLCR